MNEMLDKKDVYKMFQKVFGEADLEKIDTLIHRYGIEKIDSILGYFELNGVAPPKEGQRNNPYALLYKVAQKWNLDK